jgi:uncharacterized protein YjdB
MAAIANRAFGAQKKAPLTGVKDVDADAWYAEDLQKAVYMGTMKLDTYMRPDDSITRQEAFTVLARAFKMTDGTLDDLSAFADKDQVADWAVPGVGALVRNGYVKGSDNLLAPKANITRAQFAVVMDNMIKQYITQAGTVTSVASVNVMVNVPDVTLKDVTVSGDLIIGDGVGDGDVTLENVMIKGNLVVRGGGENSVIIKGGGVEGKVVVAKVDGRIRVSVEEGADIEVVVINDGKDDVIIEGTIGTVEVAAPEVPVVVQNGTVGKIEVTGEGGASITVARDAAVNDVVVGSNASGTTLNVEGRVAKVDTSAVSTIVSGTGTVNTVTVKEGADNTAVTTPSTKVNNEGASGVTAGGGAEVPPNSSATNDDKGAGVVTKPPSSGGGSGGSGGSGSVAVSAISVTPKELTLTVGETGQITATVSPSNATNKKVNWSSDNEDVAIVDQNGNVTAVAVGTATITATSDADSGKKDSCVVTVIADVGPVEALISSLPEVPTGEAPELPDLSKPKPDGEKLTAIYNYLAYLENAEAVAAAQEAFNALDSSDQARVDEELRAKLDAAVAKISELKAFVIDNTTIGVGTYKEDYSGLTEGAKGRIMVTIQWPFYKADGFNTEQGLTSIEVYLYNNEHEEIVRNVAVLDKMNPSKTGNWPCNLSGSFDLGVQRVSSSGSWENGLYELTGDEVTQADLPDKVVVEFTYKGVQFVLEEEVALTPEDFKSATVPVSAISVTPKELTLTVGETGQITATVSPSNATNKKVNWSSDNEEVATVDENGVVTGKKGGTATITVTSVADSSKKAIASRYYGVLKNKVSPCLPTGLTIPY